MALVRTERIKRANAQYANHSTEYIGLLKIKIDQFLGLSSINSIAFLMWAAVKPGGSGTALSKPSVEKAKFEIASSV